MRAVVVALLACGCGSKKAEQPPVPSALPPTPDQPEQVAVVQPDFPEGTRSLELRRTVAVRLDPADDAKRIGTVAIDTRVSWVRTQKAKGCDSPWIEIRPRGWICGEYVEPSKKPPYGQEVPHLDRGEIVPGLYGKVTAYNAVTYTLEKPDKKKSEKKLRAPAEKSGKTNDPLPKKRPVVAPADEKPPEPKMVEDKPLVGSVNVRQYDEITVGGKVFWKIDKKDNEYVLKSAITQHHPSLFSGRRFGDDTGWTAPIAFVWPRYGGSLAYTFTTSTGGGQNRTLPARTPVQILETAADKQGKPFAFKIGDYEWISSWDLRIFQPQPPPALLDKGERWIDVDVDNQILVAFEGDLPVYATMVSSGGTTTPTETGIYRMWLKESEADMKGLNGEDPYSVATVPWTQFFSPEKGLALHTAYWHDSFGTRRSHGCVNLAPRDARWLYFWSDPQVPPGWTMAAGVVEAPGSIVRIRTKDDPNPQVKGYAKKVLEARQQNAPVK